MAILGASGVAFAAFVIWLAVRIINRREQWALGLAIIIATWMVMSCAVLCVYHFVFAFVFKGGP